MIFFLFLLFKAVVPGGVIVYETDFGRESFFIRIFSPPERVAVADGRIEILGDPVYFNLRTPRAFDRAVFTVNYRAGSAGLVEFGPLVDKDLWRYRLQPVSNRLLDQIDLAWPSLEQDSARLWQRPGAETQYGSVADFLAEPPDLARVAAYNYDWREPFFLSDYEPAEGFFTFPFGLRGSWQAFVYIQEEDLEINLEIADLNQDRDPDPAELRLYYRNELLDLRSLVDDGIADDSGETGPLRTLSMSQAGLPAGVYKLELRAGRDIVSQKIDSAQSKFVFINVLELHRQGGSDIELWTDSRFVQAATEYPDSLQKIKAGSGELIVDRSYQQFQTELIRASSTDQSARLVLDIDGIKISGDGMFAASPGAWFNPNIKRADHRLDLNKEGIDYIVAGYRSARENGEFLSAELDVDLREAYRENGHYGFIFSSPGLGQNSETEEAMVIDSIKVSLKGRTLWQKLNGYWGR